MLSALSAMYVRFALFLAQEAQPPAPGGAPAPAGAPAVPGGAPAPGGGPPQGGSPFGSMWIPLILIFVVFYFLIIMPERRKQKARQAMIRGVRKGDQVVTTSGIIGKVTRVDEQEVVVQIDKENDVRVRFLKSAVHEVVPESGGGEQDAKDAGGAKS